MPAGAAPRSPQESGSRRAANDEGVGRVPLFEVGNGVVTFVRDALATSAKAEEVGVEVDDQLDLTDDERALLRTVRELACGMTAAEQEAFESWKKRMEQMLKGIASNDDGLGAVPLAPPPPRRTELTVKGQERLLRLVAELASMWPGIASAETGCQTVVRSEEQVGNFLRATIDSERKVRNWLKNEGAEYIRTDETTRALAPLLRAHRGNPEVFYSPTVARLFASLLLVVDHESEPGAFEEVARVLAPPRKGKRKPYYQRSRDRAELEMFRQHLRSLRAFEKWTPKELKSAEEIYNAQPIHVYPPREYADAVARYRKRPRTLDLEQLAALIWKLASRTPLHDPKQVNSYEVTAVATADDWVAEESRKEIGRIEERVKHERRRRAVSRRKRP